MSLEDIVKSLETEAKKQCADILERAESQAKRTIEEAGEDVAAIGRAAKVTAREGLHSQEGKILLEARFKAKKHVSEAKEKMIDQVFEKVKGAITLVPGLPSYENIFRQLATGALQGAGNNHSEIVLKVNARDVNLAESWVDTKIVSEKNYENIQIVESADIDSGVAIVVDNGRMTGTNTLEARLARAKQLLRTRVGAILFNDNH